MGARTPTAHRAPPPTTSSRRARGRSFAAPGLMVAAMVAIVVAVVAGGSLGGGADEPARRTLPAPETIATDVSTLRSERSGRVSIWRLPDGVTQPRDVLPMSDGSIWVTETATSFIGRLQGDSYTRYMLPLTFEEPAVFDLAAAPDGVVWFSGYPGSGLGRVSSDGRVNYFSSPTETIHSSAGITVGGDGTVWLTDVIGGAIARVVPGVSAQVDTVLVQPPNGATSSPNPFDIAEADDGTLWFTDPGTTALGSFVAGDATAVERALSIGSQSPRSIEAAPDGSMWIALAPGDRGYERGELPSLLRLDPSSGETTLVPVHDATTGFQDLAVAPDGSLWVTQAGAVLHVDPNGSTIERIRLPESIPFATSVALADDGVLWVTALEANALLEIAPEADR